MLQLDVFANAVCNFCLTINNKKYRTIFLYAKFITEKYRPEPGLEPRIFRLAHEHSTAELSRSIQFCHLNFRVHSNYPSNILYAEYHPRAVSRVRGAGVVHEFH